MGAGDHLQPQRMLYSHVVKAIWAGQHSSFLSTILPPGSHQHLPLWRSHLLQVNCSLLFSKSSTNINSQCFGCYFQFPACKQKTHTECSLVANIKLNVNKAVTLNGFCFILPFYPTANPPPTDPLPNHF